MTQNIYRVEHRIATPSNCAVIRNEEGSYSSFSVDEIKISHWDFNLRDGWKGNAWIAQGTASAEDFQKAINIFRRKLSRIIPRISLIAQSYISYISEPYLIHKENDQVAFFQCMRDRDPVGLMFTGEGEQALNELLAATDVPNEFYYYWNDVVNAIGYSAKLLPMFSAIEALVKKDGKKDWGLLAEILGEDLKIKLFGTKGQANTGLRHRLVHGEYFDSSDVGTNYLEEVHKKVVSYFNTKVLTKSLIKKDVVNPQRHLHGNKTQWFGFVKRADGGTSFELKDLINESDKHWRGFLAGSKYQDLPNQQNLYRTY